MSCILSASKLLMEVATKSSCYCTLTDFVYVDCGLCLGTVRRGQLNETQLETREIHTKNDTILDRKIWPTFTKKRRWFGRLAYTSERMRLVVRAVRRSLTLLTTVQDLSNSCRSAQCIKTDLEGKWSVDYIVAPSLHALAGLIWVVLDASILSKRRPRTDTTRQAP